MGRRCKTLLPVAGSLLQPQYSTEEDTRALIGAKQRQQYYYDKHCKPLDPISIGKTVRMKLPGRNTWNSGTCTDQVGPRSYEVKVGNGIYRRNRRQLVSTDEQPADLQHDDPLPDYNPPSKTAEPTAVAQEEPSLSREPAALRRSERNAKPPGWLKDYQLQ